MDLVGIWCRFGGDLVGFGWDLVRIWLGFGGHLAGILWGFGGDLAGIWRILASSGELWQRFVRDFAGI